MKFIIIKFHITFQFELESGGIRGSDTKDYVVDARLWLERAVDTNL